MSRNSIPSYRFHKASGQAIVTLSGRDYYLGVYGTPESRRLYEQRLAEWLASGRCEAVDPTPDLTVNEVLASYSEWAAGYYVGAGKGRPHLERVVRSLRFVADLYGPTLAARFGPLALKAVRQRMIDANYCRRHVNHCIGCVRRCFAWAASEELIPASVIHGLRAVEGLRRGRTEARESEPVQPVAERDVERAKGLLLPVLRDVVDLQLLTAMRPGEALGLRPGDVDRAGKVWIYRPPSHKTLYRGHQRLIFIGPKGQDVLARYLLRDPGAHCFSPREAMLARMDEQGRAYRPGRTRTPGESYHPTSYSHAVRTACLKAGVDPTWHPHQLRHSAATMLAREFGHETARIILGHRSLDVTKIYAADNADRAIDAISRVG